MGWPAVVGLYVGLTVVYGWPVLRSFNSGFPNDPYDPGFITWVLWWNAHVMPLTAKWWSGPIFYPVQGAMALSEVFLGIAPLSSPLQWLGLSPVATFNLIYLLSFPACALAAHALARRLTGRDDAALLAGLAFGFSPNRAAQMPHLQMLLAWWMPLGLLMLHRYLDRRRWTDLWFFGVCWLANGLSNGYYLFFFAVLLGLWMLWYARTWRDWIGVGLATAIASLPLFPLLSGYARYQAAFNVQRGIGEAEWYGADLAAFWSASHHVLARIWTFAPRPEGDLYPGIVILAVTMAGAWIGWRAQPREAPLRIRGVFLASAVLVSGVAVAAWLAGGGRHRVLGIVMSFDRPYKTVTIAVWLFIAAALCDRRLAALWRRRSTTAFYVLATIVLAVFSLGPVGRVLGVRFMYRAPYSWLMFLPGGHALRVPARFGMLALLCLGQATALLFSRLTRRGASTALVCALAAGIYLDGWVPRLPMAPLPPSVTLPKVDAALPVLELSGADTAAMFRAMRHGHPLINGYSGYIPPHYGPLQIGLANADPGAIAALQRMTPFLALVSRDDDKNGTLTALVRQADGATFLYNTEIGPAFLVPARPGPPEAPAHRLQIASVRASTNDAQSAFMLDGLPGTIWHTPAPQAPADHVDVMLDAPAVVTRVEMDIGDVALCYPRRLRIEGGEGDHVQTLWEGPLAGPATYAAFLDSTRTPLRIEVPSAAPVQRLTLSTVIGDSESPWDIAELRVFGHGP